MSLTFDKLCSVILNEGTSKDLKFSNLIVGNNDPMFTQDDILRDPTDPSKGTKLYLGTKEDKVKGIEPGDPQSIRRQLRRVNWIARKLIKKYQNKDVSLDKLTKDIADMLDQYQVKVLGWGKPDKANTGYETRVIGNLLLPPTKRTPQGKSVFMAPGMDPNAGPEQGNVPVKAPRVRGPRATKSIDTQPVSAESIQKRFEKLVQHLDAFFDNDLQDIILKHAEEGHLIRDILQDPAVKDVFDPNSVREVVKGMLKSDKITRDLTTGTLMINPEEEWLSSKIRGRVPTKPEVKEVPDEETTYGTVDAPSDNNVEEVDIDEENPDLSIPEEPSWERGHGEEDEDKWWKTK